jgi:tetrapyrrole methylase family protein/MazG family protein
MKNKLLPVDHYLESVFSAVGLDRLTCVTLIDAQNLAQVHHPSFPPSAAVIVMQVNSSSLAEKLKSILLTVYSPDHPLQLVHDAGTPTTDVESLTLSQLDCSQKMGDQTALYIPPLDHAAAFEDFQEIVAHLRAPNGCPWDREQTHQSLRTPLLEETYETLDAIDRNDPAKMAEEFGDLLLQIVLNAQIAYEAGEFSMVDVLRGINQKIIRRHPHVFGNTRVDGVSGVLKNWEQIKADERKKNGEAEKSLLDGVSVALPALNQAQEYQARAARIGFDWHEIRGVIEKVNEELEEIQNAVTAAEREGEIGDLLFAVVNLARWYGIDAESALRGTNIKFRNRFVFIEKSVAAQGKKLTDLSLEELDALWDKAKDLEE